MLRGGLVVAVVVIAAAGQARAAKHPRFEPTDLDLEESGILELDTQVGPVRGPTSWRVVAPDFEIDLGLTHWIELDLDGAYAVDSAWHGVPDNLWPSVKVAFADWHSGGRSLALGAQLGPKLPVANGTSGIGFEAIGLIAYKAGGVQAIVNVGGLSDPRITGADRPTGFEAGLDLQVDLVPDRWALLGELGGIYYTSADAHQLAATAGVQLSPNDQLDLSLVILVGFASGSDPVGVLLGASPKFAMW